MGKQNEVLIDMENFKLELELIEEPKGVFTAQIKDVCGAIVQEHDKHLAIQEVFKQAWIAISIDSTNLKLANES